jgi:serine/threonine-protein kinase
VQRLLHRCLEKDPQRRLHDVADARIELEDALDEIRTGRTTPLERTAVAPPAAPRRGRTGLAVAAGLAVLAAGAAIGRMTATTGTGAGPGGPRARVQALVAMPEGQQLAGWAWPVLALSPDGHTLAFVARPDGGVQQLYLYHLDTGRTQLVPESAEAEGPFFSPDGAFVAFAVDVSGSPRPGQLKKFSLETGLTQAICGLRDYFGGDWLADGSILLVEVPPEGLARVSSAGGRPDAFVSSTKLDGRDEARVMLWPQALPGGRKAIVALDQPQGMEAAVLDLATRELRLLGIEAAFARYARSGHLLYVHRDGTLLAVPFDPEQARTTAPAIAIARDVSSGLMEAAAVTASGTGMLAYATGYVRGSGRELSRLVRVAASGVPQPLPFDPYTYNRAPRVSPDGGRIAVTSSDGSLWIHDVGRGSRSRLPAGDVLGRGYPVWTLDGARVFFVSGQGPAYRMFSQLADGSGTPELLPMEDPSEKHPGGVAADGRVLFASYDPPGIHLVHSATRAVQTILAERTVDMPALSPDGRRLAYESTETGRREVYLRDYPGLSGKRQVSVGGARSPRFARDGRSLFFMAGTSVYSVRLEPGPDPRMGAPSLFAEIPGLSGFDVLPDGSAVVALARLPDSGQVRALQLVVDWPAALARSARE